MGVGVRSRPDRSPGSSAPWATSVVENTAAREQGNCANLGPSLDLFGRGQDGQAHGSSSFWDWYKSLIDRKQYARFGLRKKRRQLCAVLPIGARKIKIDLGTLEST